VAPGLLDELLLTVARAGHDLGLGHRNFKVGFSDFVRGFETILDRHAAVHQDEPVDETLTRYASIRKGNSLLPVLGKVNSLKDAGVPSLLEEDLECSDVKGLVVNYKDPLLSPWPRRVHILEYDGGRS